MIKLNFLSIILHISNTFSSRKKNLKYCRNRKKNKEDESIILFDDCAYLNDHKISNSVI